MSEFGLNKNNGYFQRYCGVCGKSRLCYSIINDDSVIHGFLCRRCKDNLQTKVKHGDE